MSVTFTADGREMNFVQRGGRQVGAIGTYTAANGVLTSTFTVTSVNGTNQPLPPSQTRPETMAYHLSGDSLTLSDSATNQVVATLKRSK